MFWGLHHTRPDAQADRSAHRWCGNILATVTTGLVVTLCAIALVTLSAPATVFAATPCKSNTCVIACNRTSRTCGLFPKNLYAAGYGPAPYIPLGYKRVRLTKCDRMVCPTGRSCTKPVPIGTQTSE